MPLYDLRCEDCAAEVSDHLGEHDEVVACGSCGSSMRRILRPTGVRVAEGKQGQGRERRAMARDGWSSNRDKLSTAEGAERVCYDVARASGIPADRARAASKEAAPEMQRLAGQLARVQGDPV